MEELINALPGSTFANVLFVCSWCGQMFEWCRGRGLRIFLLPGKLNLRHRRNARNLRTLPAHSCYFQHWGECRVLSIGPNGPSLSPFRHPTVVVLCRERPLSREACSASRRESPRRFSRPSAAATSSRGWSRRSVSENNPQQVAPLTFSYSRLSAPLKVQEECYTSLDICTVARTNPDTIGDVVQVPTHFPNRSGTCWASWYHCIDAVLTFANSKTIFAQTEGKQTRPFKTLVSRLCRYYSTLLQTLQGCDEQTVAAVRAGLVARLGPDMETFLQLVQNKPCNADSGPNTYNNPASWRNMPVFNIQPGFRGRDPTHLFARRSVDDVEKGFKSEN